MANITNVNRRVATMAVAVVASAIATVALANAQPQTQPQPQAQTQTHARASGRGSPGGDEKAAAVTFEDLASVPQLGAPVLSPDGKSLALVRDGQIQIAPSDGGWPATLTTTPGGKSAVAWSPDSRSLTYVSEGSIWIVPAAGGPPRRLTDARPGNGDPRNAADRQPQWSPNGKSILFDTGRRGNSDLVVVSEDGLSTSFVTSTDADEANAAWSPDGTHIAYVERTIEHFSGRLLIVDVDPVSGRPKSAARELYVAKDDRGGGWSIPRPAWSPDGSRLAVVLQDSGWDQIYLIPATGGAPSRLTEGQFEDGTPVWSPDGKSIAITSNRANLEEQHIWIVSASTSGAGKAAAQAHRLSAPVVGVESAPQWTPDSTRIYFQRTTPTEPAGLYVAAAKGGEQPRAVIRSRAFNFERAGITAPEEVHVKSKDGLDISALVYAPRVLQAGEKAPLVLWIHGGPEGQDTFSFDPWAFFLTQQGFMVVKPNYRGSSGYGEHFRNLNVEDSGGGELDDVVAAAQFAIAQRNADAARVAIGGGSHGGTMVAYAVTKQPTLFKAAIELYGVTDRASYNERTNRNAAIRWARKMGGTPQEKPEVYRKANILPDVPKITAPLLIMHGEDDPQVPPYESAQFVAALKKAGKPHLYFTYPKEGHGFTQREHRLDAWRKQIAFLTRYLDPEYGRSITSTQDIVLDKD
jgi:dipeptidyl aminopeptidase/acylaminoacyl peptidase